MSERFIKFIPSEEAMFLLLHKPKAFRLLSIVAARARWESGKPDGLLPGQCHLGDWEADGFTEQEYRTAKEILVMRQHLKIVETNRTRKKSTTGTTTAGTLVELISTTVYDLNLQDSNDRINDRATTDQRLTNDKQRKNKNVKKEQEQQPQTPSSPEGAVAVVDIPIYRCLAKDERLTQQERVLMMEYPEPRVELALAYSLLEKPTSTLIAMLRWHCQESTPPKSRKKPRPAYETPKGLNHSSDEIDEPRFKSPRTLVIDFGKC